MKRTVTGKRDFGLQDRSVKSSSESPKPRASPMSQAAPLESFGIGGELPRARGARVEITHRVVDAARHARARHHERTRLGLLDYEVLNHDVAGGLAPHVAYLDRRLFGMVYTVNIGVAVSCIEDLVAQDYPVPTPPDVDVLAAAYGQGAVACALPPLGWLGYVLRLFLGEDIAPHVHVLRFGGHAVGVALVERVGVAVEGDAIVATVEHVVGVDVAEACPEAEYQAPAVGGRHQVVAHHELLELVEIAGDARPVPYHAADKFEVAVPLVGSGRGILADAHERGNLVDVEVAPVQRGPVVFLALDVDTREHDVVVAERDINVLEHLLLFQYLASAVERRGVVQGTVRERFAAKSPIALDGEGLEGRAHDHHPALSVGARREEKMVGRFQPLVGEHAAQDCRVVRVVKTFAGCVVQRGDVAFGVGVATLGKREHPDADYGGAEHQEAVPAHRQRPPRLPSGAIYVTCLLLHEALFPILVILLWRGTLLDSKLLLEKSPSTTAVYQSPRCTASLKLRVFSALTEI